MYFLLFLLTFLSSIAFVTNLWILWGSTFFLLCHCENKQLFTMLCEEKNDFLECYVRYFCVYYKKCKISHFSGYIHIFLSLAFVFTSIGVVLMDGGCCLMSSSLTPLAHIWFCRQLYFIGLLWKLWLRLNIVLLWLIFSVYVSRSNHRGFWVFIWIGWQFFSLMC